MSCVRCFFVLSFDEQTKSEECEQGIDNQQLVTDLVTVKPRFRISLQDIAKDRRSNSYQRNIFIINLFLSENTEGK